MIYTFDIEFFESDEMFDVVSQKKVKLWRLETLSAVKNAQLEQWVWQQCWKEFTVLITLNDFAFKSSEIQCLHYTHIEHQQF